MDIITVYTDGSCLNNQMSKKGLSFGGYGCVIEYPNGMYEEFSGGIKGPKVTNNVAELLGFKKAIQRLSEIKATDIINLYTDSTYVMTTYTKNVKKWESNGWKKTAGGNIENLELIQEIYSLIQDNNLILIIKKCQAHSDVEGNNRADELARACAEDMRKVFDEEALKEEEEKKAEVERKKREKAEAKKQREDELLAKKAAQRAIKEAALAKKAAEKAASKGTRKTKKKMLEDMVN